MSLRQLIKHLPGKHNQQLHNPHSSAKPSLTDYVQQWKLSKFDLTSDKPVVAALTELPPVKPGTTRVLHGTSLHNFQSIDKQGVLTGKAVGKKEHLSEVLGYAEHEFAAQGGNAFGELVVVADVPNVAARAVNSSWLSVNRSIKPDEIVGYVVGKAQIDASELPAIMADYKKEYP